MIKAQEHARKVRACLLQFTACGPALLVESFGAHSAYLHPAEAIVQCRGAGGAKQREDIGDAGARRCVWSAQAFAVHSDVGMGFAEGHGRKRKANERESERAREGRMGRAYSRCGVVAASNGGMACEAIRMLSGLFKERLLVRELWVPRTVEEVFPFFADAANLNALTPPWLDFRILTPLPIAMKQGALIDYRIGLKGVPLRWRTLISTWKPPHCFVDEQIKGPYLLWHHTHEFVAKPEKPGGPLGTLCIDRVRYKHMGGPIGEALLVAKDLRKIFDYRQERMRELFR